LCWFAYKETHVPYETVLERIVGSTSTFSNIHEVVNDNSNCYRSMVIDVMRMNHSYSSEDSCGDEDPYGDTNNCFELLKDFDESL